MSQKVLLAVVVAALSPVAARAGQIQFYEWPYQAVPQDGATVSITMDVGYWIRIKDQDKLRIKLVQKAIHEYSGCTDMTVETNVNLTLLCSITPTGAVPGKWSCHVSPADIDAPGGTANVCATVKEADLSRTPGGAQNVHVATIAVKVVPRP